MAVDGKYVVITDKISSFEHLLAITDYLIEQSRKKVGKAATKK